MTSSLLIFGAKYLVFVPPLFGIVYFLKISSEKKKKVFLVALISLPAIYIIAKIAGQIYFDPRPFVQGGFQPLISHAADNGFPSDHALLASAAAAILMFFDIYFGAVAWIFAVLVGISRVGVGVHHPIDVIASALISLAVVCVVYTCLSKSHSSKGNNLPEK